MNESCLRVYLYPLALYSQWDTHTHTHTHTHTPTRLTVHLLCNCHEWVMSHSIFQLRLSCMSHVSQHTSFHSHYIHNETRLIYVWLSAYQHCDCHARVPSHRRPLSTLTVFTVRHSEILSCECSECKWVAQYISMEIYCETMPMNLTYIVHTSWQWRCIECEWVMNCANELWQWRSMHCDNDDALNANALWWQWRCIECEWVSLTVYIFICST